MIRAGEVIIEQFSPNQLHRDQLPLEGEAPQYPISLFYWRNIRHMSVTIGIGGDLHI